MKKIFFWLFVFALAALNWAALHDISHGEKDVWMEWTTVLVSAVLTAVFAARKIRERRV